ncbi:NLR family CARD domain-containing protein 3-like isoform X2 [Dysidea avara]
MTDSSLDVFEQFRFGSKASQKPTAKDLLVYVNPHISQTWFEVGILLAIPVHKLQEIERDHGNDVESSCMRMLVEWSLGRSATWEKLLSVIDSVFKSIKPIVAENQDNVCLNLDYFRTKASAIPTLKDLFKYVTPEYASNWKRIGILLGMSVGVLNAIERSFPTDTNWCCERMFEKWLAMDTAPSWNKIFLAIDSCTIQCETMATTVQTVPTVTKHLRTLYKHTRFILAKDEWPPDQPKHFTTVVLIHHKNRRTKRELIALIEAAKSSDIIQASQSQESLSGARNKGVSKTLKDISEIFVPMADSNIADENPYTILIEGVPGIGKTFLSKHIAYQWSNGTLLSDKKLLFLLFLRDPVVQQITCLKDLVLYFYHNDKAAIDKAEACAEFLVNNSGSEITVILDGYDELPDELKQRGFLSDLIQRKILPASNLVVTSRLSASAHFHGCIDRRVEILGFSDDARRQYMQNALNDPSQVQLLQAYLRNHAVINSYCYIPLNMTILLYLFKEMSQLPYNQTQLYNNFIFLTICHFLRKHNIILTVESDVPDIHDLPSPYKNTILNLARLSLQGLDDNKLIFTFSDIRKCCPEVDTTPELIHGYGLLQAIQHYEISQTAMSFNFVHVSVQEFLAAYKISVLPYEEELCYLQQKFWIQNYQNTWMMYVGITNGQNPAFKDFLAGDLPSSSGIGNVFLTDPIKCIYLFQCFQEVSDEKQCNVICNAKIFEKGIVDLHGCTLIPRDVEALTVFLTKSQNKVWERLDFLLCNIGDTGCSILHSALCETEGLHINKLILADNHLTTSSSKYITEISMHAKTRVLYLQGNHLQDDDYLSILVQSNTLEVLDVSGNEIQTEGAIQLSKALRLHQSCIKVLILMNNGITKMAADELALALATNTALEVINLSHNRLQSMGIIKIFGSLQESNTSLKVLDAEYNEITDWAADNIAAALKANTSLQQLNLSGNSLKTKGAIKIVNALKSNKTLKMLSLRSCDITDQAGDYIANVIAINKGLEELILCDNQLQTVGATRIIQSVATNTTLRLINLWNNNITDQIAHDVSKVLISNSTLEELVLSKNQISADGVKIILTGLCQNRALRLLVIPHLPLDEWISLKPEIAKITETRKSLYGINLTIH